MKFLLAIFTIALVAQVSLGAAISKRTADDQEDFHTLMAQVMPKIMSDLELVYKEIPDTAAYAKYRADFEEVLETYNGINKNTPCLMRYMHIAIKEANIEERLVNDESEEAVKISEIFNKYHDAESNQRLINRIEAVQQPSFDDLMENC